MDKFQFIKTEFKWGKSHLTGEGVKNLDDNDIEYLISEVERLRTVEQAYQALLSATAGQQK